ncbi:hypothetical protein RF11_07591 [Thelohanellus kitauei]|uniref:DUF4371 domain-containing protein n=1 Tax=Thelohanellus kitauei TaxID=669202 RepID=A0A0C2NDR5_THEKT|nr:hypothetical protein RF11_07591 [Thelohanellus kitauei]
MVQSKLLGHLDMLLNFLNKDTNYFRYKTTGVWKSSLTFGAVEIIETSLLLARQPNRIADGLLSIKAKHIVRVMIGDEYVDKLNRIYISLDTVYRIIADISTDIRDQIIHEKKSSTLLIFSIHVDESTDV